MNIVYKEAPPKIFAYNIIIGWLGASNVSLVAKQSSTSSKSMGLCCCKKRSERVEISGGKHSTSGKPSKVKHVVKQSSIEDAIDGVVIRK